MDYVKVLSRIGIALSNPACAAYSNLCFKPKQIQCIELILKGHDVVAVLPTGYGKSLIFQLLPWILPPKSEGENNIVLVVCPLSSIIKDQISLLNERGIRAAYLSNFTDDDDTAVDQCLFSDDDKKSSTKNVSDVIKEAKIDFLFGHPESFLSNQGRSLLKSPPYQRKVVACAIDEVHCVNIW